MADPVPGRPGYGALVDRVGGANQRLGRLERPGGTQRSGTTSTVEDTVAYLQSLQAYGSSGASSTTLSAQAADGVVRWFFVSSTVSQRHIIGPIEVPTGRMLVTASLGEASMTPADGFMIAYVSFNVQDADGKVLVGNGARTGRLYFNQRIGAGLTTGPSQVIIPSTARGPFTITPVVGIWGQNTGSGQTITCVYNNPSLRVEIVGSGVY